MRKLTLGKIVKNGVTYSGSSDNANNVKYNNNASNLDATNVQEAIDKLDESVDTLNSNLNNSIGDISNVGNSTYNSVEKLLKYYIDNNYLPDVNDIALVPKMTSNNTPSGNCYFSCGEYSTDRGAYTAFDNNMNTHATSIATDNFPVRLVYDFGANKKVRVKKASYSNIESGGHSYAVNGAEIQGSNDGTNWNTLGIFNIPASESNNKVINCSGDIPYRYICLMQPSKNNTNSGKGTMSLTELQFYGTEI